MKNKGTVHQRTKKKICQSSCENCLFSQCIWNQFFSINIDNCLRQHHAVQGRETEETREACVLPNAGYVHKRETNDKGPWGHENILSVTTKAIIQYQGEMCWHLSAWRPHVFPRSGRRGQWFMNDEFRKRQHPHFTQDASGKTSQLKMDDWQ